MPPAALFTPENSQKNYNWTRRVSPSVLHSKLYNKNYHANVKAKYRVIKKSLCT
jgi:hypothetical protein